MTASLFAPPRTNSLLAAMFLLCSVALACLWVRSLTVADMFRIEIAGRWFYLDFRPGGIQFGTFPKREYDVRPPRYWRTSPPIFNSYWLLYVREASHYFNLAGFQFLYSVPSIPSYCTFVIPYWFLLLATLLPAALLRRRARSLRRLEGFCPTCGYDLRASKDRCPECGTPIPVLSKVEGAAKSN